MHISVLKHEKIFPEGQFFPECHASTLVKLNDGSIVCAWFAGTCEKHDDVAIWCSVMKNDTWTDPAIACDTPGIPCWNPVLFSPDGINIILYFKSGKEIPQWKTLMSTSDDGGKTWSAYTEAFEGDIGGRGPVKNKPIRLSDGTVIAPASIEKPGEWDAFVDISRDGGYTWGELCKVPLDHEKLSGKGVIQPTLWESKPGCVHMFLRSGEGFVYRSDSTDYGVTWCEAYKTDIPNNNSGIDLIKTENGQLLLLCNPVGKNWGRRSPLSLLSSNDNGYTWSEQMTVDSDDDPKDCEFSYPAIISDKNIVHACYTWKRRSVAFISLEIDN